MDLEILNIASYTNNLKNIGNYTHHYKLKNSLCGDEIKIKLLIENNKIKDFGYQGNSCIYCQASASMLSKISINKNIEKINDLCSRASTFFTSKVIVIDNEFISLKKLFKKKNCSRKECILLPFKTLKKTLDNSKK